MVEIKANMIKSFPKIKIPSKEKDLLRFLLGMSFGLHIILLVVNFDQIFSTNKTSIEDEWEIEAELAVGLEGMGQEDTIDRSVKGKEIRVIKQTLPQLTKSFEVEEKKEEKLADIGETFADPELEKKEKKRKAAARLKKKEALRRLLKERARRDKKFAEKTTSPIAKKLQARKRELEGKEFSLGSKKKLNKFKRQVQASVRRYYSLPEVYRVSAKPLKTAIRVKLDESGHIVDIAVSKSSGDEGFDAIGVNTMKKAAPLPPPPRELVGKPFILNFSPERG
jgi:TonB family protein